MTLSAPWTAALRVAAVTVGAFCLASLATTALSLVLARIGVSRADAVTIALLASAPIYAIVALASAYAPSAIRAWRWLLVTAVPLACATWALLPSFRA